MSNALNTTIVVVSPTVTFPMSAVTLYEVVQETDKEGKPIGKLIPQITLTNGKEIDLLPKQQAQFEPLWNRKVTIDDKLRACVDAVDKYLTEQTTQLVQSQPQPATA